MNTLSADQRCYQRLPRSDSPNRRRALRCKSANQGFTLIELILYIALITIFISSAILLAWDIIYGRVKSSVQQEVTQNLRLASKRIIYEVRNATDITLVEDTRLCLSSDRNPLVFYLSSDRLMIGWGGSCTLSTQNYALTSNQVTVSTLDFDDLSISNSKNIQFTITIESIGDRKEWERTQSYTSSVELRSN